MVTTTLRRLPLVVVVGVFAALLMVTAPAHGQTETCLSCICEAATSCNATVGCTAVAVAGRREHFCGPFHISMRYWLDAGSPVLGGDSPNRPGAFEDCTNDVHCAAQTFRQYMGTFRQDCNGDGIVDCSDYAAIHQEGGYGCDGADFTFTTGAFYRRFSACLRVLTAAHSNNNNQFNNNHNINNNQQFNNNNQQFNNNQQQFSNPPNINNNQNFNTNQPNNQFSNFVRSNSNLNRNNNNLNFNNNLNNHNIFPIDNRNDRIIFNDDDNDDDDN